MTPVEIMALLLALGVVVKLAVVSINPKLWIDEVTKKALSNSTLVLLASIVLVGITLPLLLVELSIVQIFAVFLFLAGLMIMSMAPYSVEIIKIGEKMIAEGNVLKKAWLAIVVWLILAVWVLYEILIV